MSANKTKNLKLHSWVRSDKFSMDELNENFEIIDAAVGALRDGGGGKEAKPKEPPKG